MGADRSCAVVESCHPGLSAVRLILSNAPLWNKFHREATEMIITKSGRRMFPSLRVRVSGLEADCRYLVMLEAALRSGSRYKFGGGGGGSWTPVGAAEPQAPASTRIYLHPDSPASGSHWMQQDVLFHRVKLTNNTLHSAANLVLTSMHKYQLCVHLVKTSDIMAVHWSPTVTFSFPQTEFIAVTAYQNEKITKLKIDNNPFAKGFRENGQARTKRKILATRRHDCPDGVKQKRLYDICSEEQDEEVDIISCGSPPPVPCSDLRTDSLSCASGNAPSLACSDQRTASSVISCGSGSPPPLASPNLRTARCSPPPGLREMSWSPDELNCCPLASCTPHPMREGGPYRYPLYPLYPLYLLPLPPAPLPSPYLHPGSPPFHLHLKPHHFSLKLN